MGGPQTNGDIEWKKIEIVNGKKLTTKQQSTQDRLKSVPPAEHRRVQEEKAVEFTEEELKIIAFLDAKLAELNKEEEKAVEPTLAVEPRVVSNALIVLDKEKRRYMPVDVPNSSKLAGRNPRESGKFLKQLKELKQEKRRQQRRLKRLMKHHDLTKIYENDQDYKTLVAQQAEIHKLDAKIKALGAAGFKRPRASA